MNHFELDHFVQAQDPVYASVLAELRGGRKRSHWMWFIFPQIAGLGHSSMAQRYALDSLSHARAYLAHPLLGARLRECTHTVLALDGRSAAQVFGAPDDVKLRSSLTLFARADTASDSVFQACLEHYFDGPDLATLARI